MSAAGETAEAVDAEADGGRRSSPRWTMLVGAFVALALAAAAVGLWAAGPASGGGASGKKPATAGSVARPAEDSAAVGFARDMSVHHQQAVEMSFVVRDRSRSDDVRRLAYDIANTQANQRGMMLGWLDLWGYAPTSVKPPMAWMGMGPPSEKDRAAGVLMPGMASRTQLDTLRKASPKDADVQFLRLMIAHHKGGIHMAEGVLADTKQPQVRALARSMVNGQQSEIAVMRHMLKVRGVRA